MYLCSIMLSGRSINKLVIILTLFMGIVSPLTVSAQQPAEREDDVAVLFFHHLLMELTDDSLFYAMEDSLVYGKIPFPLTEYDNPALYETIEQWYGVPYRRSGMSMKGTDCSGFVLSVYRDVYNIDLLRSSREMAQHILPVEKTELQEGDLIFFRIRNSKAINHVGIYLRDGYFVHASLSRGVIIDTLERAYWKRYYYTSGRCF